MRERTRWDLAMLTHYGHEGFRRESWAVTRELGFSCNCEACGGEETTWRFPITDVRMADAWIRRFFTRPHRIPKDVKNAQRRAKKLLLHHLTPKQKKTFRESQSFDIVGKDDKHYRITEGTSANVRLLENGVETHTLCVVFKDYSIPIYDLMLAQKLLLESNPKAFWKIAVVRPIAPQEPLRQTG